MVYNKNEITFCGYSGSGKTTLIEKITAILSKDYSIGYVKHDTHSFMMDHPSKDTSKIYNSGADVIFINDPNHWAIISKGKAIPDEHLTILNQKDIVVIEGYKNSLIPKFLLIDMDEKIIPKITNNEFKNIIGIIYQNKKPRIHNYSGKYFHRDNIIDISENVLKYFKLTNKREL